MRRKRGQAPGQKYELNSEKFNELQETVMGPYPITVFMHRVPYYQIHSICNGTMLIQLIICFIIS